VSKDSLARSARRFHLVGFKDFPNPGYFSHCSARLAGAERLNLAPKDKAVSSTGVSLVKLIFYLPIDKQY
jgi:hypothetical protein